jgi:hypothetical protein
MQLKQLFNAASSLKIIEFIAGNKVRMGSISDRWKKSGKVHAEFGHEASVLGGWFRLDGYS